MTSLLRRLRGVVRTGLSWAAAWGVAGAILSPVLGALANVAPGQPFLDALIFGAVNGWYGFLAGSLFSGLLMIVGRRRTLEDLTTSQIGWCGVGASLLLTIPPSLYMAWGHPGEWRSDNAVYLVGSVVLSAACAIGTLLVARRAAVTLSNDEVSALQSPADVPFASRAELDRDFVRRPT